MQPVSEDALQHERAVLHQNAIVNQDATTPDSATPHTVLLPGSPPLPWGRGDLDVTRARHRPQNRVKNETWYGTARLTYKAPHRAVANIEFLRTLTSPSEADTIFNTVRGGVGVRVDAITPALLLSSLPETYAYSDIALLLTKTRELVDPNRVNARLGRTDHTIKDVMHNLTSPDGHGLFRAFEALGRRHELLDDLHQEIPGTSIHYINQVSLAYTLLTFSFTPLLAITRAKQGNFSDDDRLKWLRMWNVIGSLMGIEPGGLPDNLTDAAKLLNAIQNSEPYRRTGKTGDTHTAAITLMEALITPDRWDPYTTWADPNLVTHLNFPKPIPKD